MENSGLTWIDILKMTCSYYIAPIADKRCASTVYVTSVLTCYEALVVCVWYCDQFTVQLRLTVQAGVAPRHFLLHELQTFVINDLPAFVTFI